MYVIRYMLLADYEAYIKCQEQVSATYAVSVSPIHLYHTSTYF